MAEGIISCVMQKLTDAVVNEFLLQHGIGDQVGALSRELSRLQAFLKDVDKKQIRVESLKHWMKEIRELAYSIEDVIDNFLSEVNRPKPSILWRVIKRLKTIPAQYKLGDEISKIQARIQEIHESRVRYDIDHLGTGSGGIRLPIRPPVLSNIDPEIVGFEADQQIVLQKLLDQSTTRHSVVSVWGPGGLGKTTLVQKSDQKASSRFTKS
ncbi:hypothetical protein LUZ63_012638 [Rhynchospora breviuscula]|uniref:Disease resistance N-terminal domain-containing protein n=1 Tax=Rhynchospora breviuscula TaxID=2022672 RepID=A0A9Q0HS57_9POAL|nr:hypothetical protein LUZ63_012638 [Rhynchospora breviuscula]